MVLELPRYVVVGEKIASMERTPDGGVEILGWDFVLRALTREAGDMDDFFGGHPDMYPITKEEFDQRLVELRGAVTLRNRRRTAGPPEPLTRRRGKVEEVSNLERAIREGALSAPCGEGCGHGDREPEEAEKARSAVKNTYGEDDPLR